MFANHFCQLLQREIPDSQVLVGASTATVPAALVGTSTATVPAVFSVWSLRNSTFRYDTSLYNMPLPAQRPITVVRALASPTHFAILWIDYLYDGLRI